MRERPAGRRVLLVVTAAALAASACADADSSECYNQGRNGPPLPKPSGTPTPYSVTACQ